MADTAQRYAIELTHEELALLQLAYTIAVGMASNDLETQLRVQVSDIPLFGHIIEVMGELDAFALAQKIVALHKTMRDQGECKHDDSQM